MTESNIELTSYISDKIKSFGTSYKYIIYSALYGEVDQLHDPIGFKDGEALFVCFTDRKDIKSDYWNIIYLESQENSRLAAKYWKIFGYKEFTKYAKYVVWVDSSIKIIDSLMPLFENKSLQFKNASILTFHHPKRDCAYSEILWVFLMGKDSIGSLLKTWIFLKRNHYVCGQGLIAGTVIVRKGGTENDSLLNDLMSEWWQCIKRYSTRDQLTFNFLASRKNFYGVHSYLNLDMDVYNCHFFKGSRVVKFNSKVNPSSGFNLRHKFFHLILMLRNYIKNKL